MKNKFEIPQQRNGWTERGRCRNYDPDSMFGTQAEQKIAAKRICGPCPVRKECAADALDNRTEFGVWGGMTERERRAFLKKHPDVTNWRQALGLEAEQEAVGATTTGESS